MSDRHIVCSQCGAQGNANCDCGVEYITAAAFAAKAVARSPEMSNRAIAEETGVGETTVRRTRKSTAPFGAVESRIGRDGKKRKMPRKKPAKKSKVGWGAVLETDPIEEPCHDCKDLAEQWQHSLANLASEAIVLQAYWTRLFGEGWKKFPVTSDLVTLARQAAGSWNELATMLERRKAENGNRTGRNSGNGKDKEKAALPDQAHTLRTSWT